MARWFSVCLPGLLFDAYGRCCVARGSSVCCFCCHAMRPEGLMHWGDVACPGAFDVCRLGLS